MKPRLLLAVAVLCSVALVAVVVRVLATGQLPFSRTKSGCALTGTAYEFSTEQTANAATIAAVATGRGLPERAVVIAFATAMQESRLKNLDYGDRDSVGLFQQRPSQGWGEPAQIMDPRYAATRFFEALEKVPHWQTLPLAEAAQAVQKSGYPQEYAKWEPRAAALGSAFVGGEAGALHCEFPKARPSDSRSGQTPGNRVDAMLAGLDRDFPGAHRIGGHGSSVEVSPANWTAANWLVANGERLGLESVSFSGHTWTRKDGAKGWRSDTQAPADRVRVGVGDAA